MTNKEIFGQIETIKSKLRIHDEITEGLVSPVANHLVEQVQLGYEAQIEELQKQLETTYTPLPICPHCGLEETQLSSYSEGGGTTNCAHCESEFTYEVAVHYSFTTKKA